MGTQGKPGGGGYTSTPHYLFITLAYSLTSPHSMRDNMVVGNLMRRSLFTSGVLARMCSYKHLGYNTD